MGSTGAFTQIGRNICRAVAEFHSWAGRRQKDYSRTSLAYSLVTSDAKQDLAMCHSIRGDPACTSGHVTYELNRFLNSTNTLAGRIGAREVVITTEMTVGSETCTDAVCADEFVMRMLAAESRVRNSVDRALARAPAGQSGSALESAAGIDETALSSTASMGARGRGIRVLCPPRRTWARCSAEVSANLWILQEKRSLEAVSMFHTVDRPSNV